MNWTARRHRFRQILAGNDCITPATVFDPLSARMIEDLGGQVGMLAGSVAAMSILGAPDKMLITASEFADKPCGFAGRVIWRLLPMRITAMAMQ